MDIKKIASHIFGVLILAVIIAGIGHFLKHFGFIEYQVSSLDAVVLALIVKTISYFLNRNK